ncbi:helix-turn-helix transcriptional regulator [Zophobihabitans entericus]|uniref:Helix-turn-helix transcriptional regulator n=1 Tax=Zophobihabitans entericus TaxID=1635327 RepID=A0A6G9IC34_9GAMM|nr:AraC family transcriptional regulator [Zophobihabitans entericus]QIQ21392.1 helix-turn-helix transcriptional regulator [Zophobihabitans entericus]
MTTQIPFKVYASDDHLLIVDAPFYTQKHRHQFLHIILTLDHYSMGVQVAGQDVICQGLILQSNTEHVLNLQDRSSVLLLIDNTSSLGQLIKKRYLNSDKKYFILPMPMVSALRELFASISNNVIDTKTYHRYWVSFYQILGLESHLYLVQEKDQRITKALELLNAKDNYHLSLAQVAEMVYLSPSRFSHLFKEYTGCTLKSHLLFKQVLSALILVSKGRSITESALEAGFDSPSHFSTACKRLVGFSPNIMYQVSCFLKVALYY